MLSLLILGSALILQSNTVSDPGPLDTKVKTGNEAQRTCKYVSSGIVPPEKALFSTAYCMGYIDAVKEGMGESAEKAYCSPDSVTIGQTYKVIMKYLELHPEKLHLAFEQLIEESLRSSFPCEVRAN